MALPLNACISLVYSCAMFSGFSWLYCTDTARWFLVPPCILMLPFVVFLVSACLHCPGTAYRYLYRILFTCSCAMFRIWPAFVWLLPFRYSFICCISDPDWPFCTSSAHLCPHLLINSCVIFSDSTWFRFTSPAYRRLQFVHRFLCPTLDPAYLSGTGTAYRCLHFVPLFPVLYFRFSLT
jgi:hypothetical protein